MTSLFCQFFCFLVVFFVCVITAFKNFNYGLGSCCSQCCITEAFLFSVGFEGGVLRCGLSDGGKWSTLLLAGYVGICIWRRRWLLYFMSLNSFKGSFKLIIILLELNISERRSVWVIQLPSPPAFSTTSAVFWDPVQFTRQNYFPIKKNAYSPTLPIDPTQSLAKNGVRIHYLLSTCRSACRLAACKSRCFLG